MWFTATMSPPCSGMFSRPRQSRFVKRYNSGWTTMIASRYQKPNRPRRTVRVCHARATVRIGEMQPSYWSVVIPVKLLRVAKSRLDFFADADRSALALAMAMDTVSAAVASDAVGEVIVVTNDERAAAAAREVGAVVVEDEPDAGLNAALQHGAAAARARRPDCGVAALAADVPALRAAEL